MNNVFYSERGKGFPLVLLHGFCETHQVWDSFIEALSEDFRIITPDLPGFGKSPLPEGSISLNDIALQLLGWLEKLQIRQCLVIGHSLGGYLTLAMAQEKPDVVVGFGLFHSTAKDDSEEKRKNRDRVFEFVQTNGTQPFIDTFVPALFYRKDHTAIERVHQMASKTPQRSLLAYTLAMRDRPDRLPFLRAYKGDSLLIAGKHDSIIPLEMIEEQAAMNPNCTFCVLENSGHMGMFEDRTEAQRSIRSFGFEVALKASKL